MDTRTINEHYAEIGAELIKKKPLLRKIEDTSIVYLSSTLKKRSADKIIKAQCEKISEKYKWSIPCDFTITVFEPNCIGMSEKQMEILIYHELLHIKIDEDGNYSVRPHDLEDFRVIIDEYGVDWDKVEEQIQNNEEGRKHENNDVGM